MKTRWTAVGLLAGLTAINGCDRTPSEPALDVPTLDAALVAAQEAQGDVETMREPGVPGLRFPALHFPSLDGDRPDCPEDGAHFRCPPEDQDGITVTHEVTFLDASGATQDAFDETTTDQVIFHMSISGTGMPPLGRPGRGFHDDRPDVQPLESTVERERWLTASGLAGDNDVVTWNGTGESTAVHSFLLDGVEWTRAVSTQSTVTDVVIPYPRVEDAWPLSGSITEHLTHTGAGPNGDVSQEIEAVITFDGTQFATVTVNGETFQIDLSERGHRWMGGHARMP